MRVRLKQKPARSSFLANSSSEYRLSGNAGSGQMAMRPSPAPVLPAFLLAVLFGLIPATAAAQGDATLPGAPEPQQQKALASQTSAGLKAPAESPCQIKRDGDAFVQAAAAGAAAPDPNHPPVSPKLEPAPCPPLAPLINWYARFLNGPQVKPLRTREKGVLAIRNLVDPFNAITIAGNSAIFIAFNSHSAYGPGMGGFGGNVGITYAEDGIGEFFGTFLIPSIVHQDPHYHRMPQAGVKRRILHAIDQVEWTQGDNGKGMLNYATLLGFAIDGQLANMYVPGINTNASATASRYVIGLATAPIDNFITEFLPDVARRIHVRAVLVQRIIDQVARTDSGP